MKTITTTVLSIIMLTASNAEAWWSNDNNYHLENNNFDRYAQYSTYGYPLGLNNRYLFIKTTDKNTKRSNFIKKIQERQAEAIQKVEAKRTDLIRQMKENNKHSYKRCAQNSSNKAICTNS